MEKRIYDISYEYEDEERKIYKNYNYITACGEEEAIQELNRLIKSRKDIKLERIITITDVTPNKVELIPEKCGDFRLHIKIDGQEYKIIFYDYYIKIIDIETNQERGFDFPERVLKKVARMDFPFKTDQQEDDIYDYNDGIYDLGDGWRLFFCQVEDYVDHMVFNIDGRVIKKEGMVLSLDSAADRAQLARLCGISPDVFDKTIGRPSFR